MLSLSQATQVQLWGWIINQKNLEGSSRSPI